MLYILNHFFAERTSTTLSIYSHIHICPCLYFVSIVLIRIAPPKCQNHLPEEKGAMDTVIIENIKQKILSWPCATCNPYHFGGVEFRVNKRDMGHIHGEKLADLPFPIEIRKDLIASGKALPHIIYPESRWISYIIHSEEDTPKLADLFRIVFLSNCYIPRY